MNSKVFLLGRSTVETLDQGKLSYFTMKKHLNGESCIINSWMLLFCSHECSGGICSHGPIYNTHHQNHRRKIPSRSNPPPELAHWLDTFQVSKQFLLNYRYIYEYHIQQAKHWEFYFAGLEPCWKTVGAWSVNWDLWTYPSTAYDGNNRTTISEGLHIITTQRGIIIC